MQVRYGLPHKGDNLVNFNIVLQLCKKINGVNFRAYFRQSVINILFACARGIACIVGLLA